MENQSIKTEKLGSFRKAIYDKVSKMLGREITPAEYRTLHVLMVDLYDFINDAVPKQRIERHFICENCKADWIKPSKRKPLQTYVEKPETTQKT